MTLKSNLNLKLNSTKYLSNQQLGLYKPERQQVQC